MVYRDDRDALHLQLNALESENGRLKKDLGEITERYEALVKNGHELRRTDSRTSCTMCGGSLLPVALFAGRDARRPVPLQISTLRYRSPDGGFTHTGTLHSLACASCGYLHNFLAFDEGEGPIHDDEPEPEP